MALIESFMQTIRNWLRVPQGASLRKSGVGTSTVSVFENDYVQTIIGITVDDICIGDAPLSINYDLDTPDEIVQSLNAVVDELNDIVKWVAEDLCTVGYSIYDASVSKQNKLVLNPYLEDVEFYLTKNKEVVVFPIEGNTKKSLTDKLVFINYSKRDLSVLTDVKKKSASLLFKINPRPMQLSNVDRTVSGLENAENSIVKYRTQLGRVARWANVDVGVSQGDTQKDVVDTISSAINANSVSLSSTSSFTEFDDNIPVLPNRRGLGKVEIVSDVPSADIKSLADLDYWISKLTLNMRFPGSYMDFSKNLDESAVSLIRGDLRYSKLCSSVRTKIERTINEFLNASKFAKYLPVVSLTKLPTSEDDDIITALREYVSLASDVEQFVNDESISTEQKLHRLQMLHGLFGSSVKSPQIQSWFDSYEEYLTSTSESSESDGGSSDDFESFESSDGGPSDDFESFESSDGGRSDGGPSDDFESFESQTE